MMVKRIMSIVLAALLYLGLMNIAYAQGGVKQQIVSKVAINTDPTIVLGDKNDDKNKDKDKEKDKSKTESTDKSGSLTFEQQLVLLNEKMSKMESLIERQ